MFSKVSGNWIQSKTVFFGAVDLPEHQRNDPWWNWVTSFFHQNFHFSDPQNSTRSNLVRQVLWSDFANSFFKTSHNFMLTCNKIISWKDVHFIFQILEKVTSRTNSGNEPDFSSLPILGRKQEECFAPHYYIFWNWVSIIWKEMTFMLLHCCCDCCSCGGFQAIFLEN